MGKYCFGIDVGGTSVKCGLFQTDGVLVEKWEIPTRKENSGEAILPDIAKTILDKIAERIYNYPEVNSVYLISGGFDLMVTLEGKTLREVSQFVTDKLSTLDQVLSTKTNFILKKYKDHGTVMTGPAKKDERTMMS